MDEDQDDDLQISYDLLVENALRGVVREALLSVQEHGLPGEHHFYITFRTEHPGVSLAPRLKAQHPEDMTIVLQHQFWNLIVTPEWFSVDLSFQSKVETLRIPFAAVTAFADPFAKFMLQFQSVLDAGEEDDDEAFADLEEDGHDQDLRSVEDKPAPSPEGGNVVTLDLFRKK